MSKGLARSLSRGTTLQQPTFKVHASFDAEIVMEGTSGVGYGTIPLGLLPEGNVLALGAAITLTLDGTGQATIVNAWDGDIAVGTEAAANGAFASGEMNIIPNLAVKAGAGAKLTPLSGRNSAPGLAGVIFDNTAGDVLIHLNLLVDDADISGDPVIQVKGDFWMLISVLGDD